MRKLTLYHGSTEIIKKPIFGEGKSYNDYGLGFYCTEHIELAKEWACTESKSGFVNKYEISTTNLSVLDLSSEEFSVLNWLAILMENRRFRIGYPVLDAGKKYLIKNFLPNYKDYDIIVGYRADDSYFSFARAFVSNSISLTQLSAAMKLGDLGIQVVLKSEKSFSKIKFIDYEVADNAIYYPKRKARDEDARNKYKEILSKSDINGIFMRDIIKEGMKSNDERLC